MKKTITYKEIKDKVLDIINNGGGGGGYVTPQLIASNLVAEDTFTVPSTVNKVIVLIRTNGELGGNHWYHEFDNNILPDGSLNFDCLWDGSNGSILSISKDGNNFTILEPLFIQGVVSYNFTIYGV